MRCSGSAALDLAYVASGRFDGYFQEFRYWNTILSESQINQHTLNPRSIVSHDPTSSYFNLLYRLPLGSELENSGSTGDNTIYSVHPASTGSVTPTASFLGTGSTTVSYGIVKNFVSNSFSPETYYSLKVSGGDAVLADIQLKYKSPMHVGKFICVYGSIKEIKGSKMIFELEAKRIEKNQKEVVVAEGALTYVAVNDKGRPRKFRPNLK